MSLLRHNVSGLPAKWQRAIQDFDKNKKPEPDLHDLHEQETLNHGRVLTSKDPQYLLVNVLADNLDYGWIAPDGSYWGCAPNKHDSLVEYALGILPGEAEQKGWIRVCPTTWVHCSHSEQISSSKHVTLPQKKALERVGRCKHSPNERMSLSYKKAFPRGNSAMKKLRQDLKARAKSAHSEDNPSAQPS